MLLVAALSAMALAASAPADPVHVHCAAPRFERREFDPARPPAEAPLGGDRDAWTDTLYHARVRLAVRTASQRDDGRAVTVELVVDAVTMDLSLDVVEHLPAGADAGLVAHEEAHRRIGEAFLAASDDLARERARALVGRRLEARGVDAETAARDAVAEAARELGRAWVDQVVARAGTAQAELDDLTDHGRSGDPPADEAARQVLARRLPAAATE